MTGKFFLCAAALLVFFLHISAYAAAEPDDSALDPETSAAVEVSETLDSGDTIINVTVNVPPAEESEEPVPASVVPDGVDVVAELEDLWAAVDGLAEDGEAAGFVEPDAADDAFFTSTSDLDDSAAPGTDFLLLLEDIFGSYTPRTYTVDTYLDDGTVVTTTEVVPGLAGVDWNWVLGAAVFLICFYSFFRVLGLVISRA